MAAESGRWWGRRGPPPPRTYGEAVRSPSAGALALVLALTAGVACSGDEGPAREPPFAGEATDLEGSLEAFEARPSERSVLAAVLDIEADQPVHVEVNATSPDASFALPRTARALRTHRLPVVGMRADATYDLTVALFDTDGHPAGSGAVTFTTGPLPDFIPELEVATSEPEAMAPGYTLFDTGRWDLDNLSREPIGLLVAVDEEGQVVWYYQNPPAANDARLTPAGTILVQYPPVGIREIDLLGTTLRSWTWGDPEGDDPRTVSVATESDIRSFHHEAYLAPSGNILTLGIRDRRLTRAQQAVCEEDEPFGIAEDVVIEFTPEGEVLHEWPLADVIDPEDVPGTALCRETGDTRDWAHANGVILDEDRNAVIVTARHLDLTLAFRHEDDAAGPSGELLWSLGPDGTLPLTEGTFSYHLHAPELQGDGSLLIYDNGNGRPGGVEFSRAVRYELDLEGPPARWSARQVWEHLVDDEDGEPVYADFLGDADRQPGGNVLIDHGGIGRGEGPPRARIIEVVPEGASGGPIVFDVRLGAPWVSYRAERFPSFYVGPRWSVPRD